MVFINSSTAATCVLRAIQRYKEVQKNPTWINHKPKESQYLFKEAMYQRNSPQSIFEVIADSTS